MPRYREVIFLQDPADFDRWYVEYDEDKEQGFRYLLMWEYGDDIPLNDFPSWGTYDTIEYFEQRGIRYAMTHNWNLSYVALTEIVE